MISRNMNGKSMKITVASISLLALAVASTACTTGSSSTEATEPTAGEEPATPVAAEPVAPPEPPAAPVIEGRGKAVLHTSVGPITITFFPEQAPQTVKHIAGLMRAGCYDGVDVFRLEPGFVAQVASVSNHECHPDAMSTVADEPTPLKHDRLHLSLARGQEANSGTSSFSMMLGPGPHMDLSFQNQMHQGKQLT